MECLGWLPAADTSPGGAQPRLSRRAGRLAEVQLPSCRGRNVSAACTPQRLASLWAASQC